MKLLFLDVDGVLNYEMCPYKLGIYYGVDPKNVKLLREIIDATGAKIVLSSTWRRDILVGMPIEVQESVFAVDLMSKLKEEGMKIYDMTSEQTNDSNRKQQIEELIAEYRHDGQPVEAWCVLDDDLFMGFEEPEFQKHLVTTNFYEGGLNRDDVKKAIRILNGETQDEQ